MATPFNLDAFPLRDTTLLKPDLGTEVERMDDGSVSVRVLTNARPADLLCEFAPMSLGVSAFFREYIYLNPAEEWEITDNGITYVGHIDGKSIERPVSDGVLHWWRVPFILTQS